MALFSSDSAAELPSNYSRKNPELNLKQIMTQTVLMDIRRQEQGRKNAGYERDI
jgi:hypothetical protein